MIAPIVSKTTLSEQKQDSLNTSVSVVAPEMHCLPFSNTFSLFCPPREAWLVTSPSATRAQLLLLEPCIDLFTTVIFIYLFSLYPVAHAKHILLFCVCNLVFLGLLLLLFSFFLFVKWSILYNRTVSLPTRMNSVELEFYIVSIGAEDIPHHSIQPKDNAAY